MKKLIMTFIAVVVFATVALASPVRGVGESQINENNGNQSQALFMARRAAIVIALVDIQNQTGEAQIRYKIIEEYTRYISGEHYYHIVLEKI